MTMQLGRTRMDFMSFFDVFVKVWMVTFGQPRVGNHAFAQLFGQLTASSQCCR